MGDKINIHIKPKVKASNVAKFLGSDIYGEDVQIRAVKPLDDISEYTLVFSKSKVADDLLKTIEHVCFITSQPPDTIGSNAFIVVKNPRLAFAKVLSEFFVEKKIPGMGKNSIVDPTAKVAKSAIIGNGCSIGRNVVIGDNTEICNNVVIGDGVIIGKQCLIKSNTVVGEKGFGFDFEDDGTPIQIPHLGAVQIADFVEIGAINTVVRGTLNDTIIHEHVKTDDHVHIAHNCVIGAKTIITACAEISGSVIVGEKCWLGPNCSIMNKITIGDYCLIGLGAVIRKNVLPGAVMAGNPAKVIRIRKF